MLLSFAHEGLFRARFTDDIMDEWTRTLICLKPHLETSVGQQEAMIREVFDECFVTGYQPIIPSLKLPCPGDRHVLAAAIRASAQVIVTENRRDFPAAVLEEYGIETFGADDMLVSTYELYPSEAARALSRVRKRYRTPAMTASEFLFDLTKSGLPKLAATLRRDIKAL